MHSLSRHFGNCQECAANGGYEATTIFFPGTLECIPQVNTSINNNCISYLQKTTCPALWNLMYMEILVKFFFPSLSPHPSCSVLLGFLKSLLNQSTQHFHYIKDPQQFCLKIYKPTSVCVLCKKSERKEALVNPSVAFLLISPMVVNWDLFLLLMANIFFSLFYPLLLLAQ